MKNLKEISTRLEIAKKNIKNVEKNNKSSNAASLGKALKISTELVAAVIVGSTRGFLLDNESCKCRLCPRRIQHWQDVS